MDLSSQLQLLALSRRSVKLRGGKSKNVFLEGVWTISFVGAYETGAIEPIGYTGPALKDVTKSKQSQGLTFGV